MAALKPKTDALADLLTSWNDGQASLNSETRSRLLHLAERELGALVESSDHQATTIEELSSLLRPLLPVNLRGQTMADVFAELRDQAWDECRIPSETIKWDSAWSELGKSIPRHLAFTGAPDMDEFLTDVLLDLDGPLDGPCDLVGETVRWIWKARGGRPFWELPPYEQNWCASQGLFHDLRRIIAPHATHARIEPSTLLSSLIPPKEHGGLLCSIETHFGVWLGRRPKEGCLPVLIAGVLVSPLSMMVAGGLAVAVTGMRDNAAILGVIIYVISVGLAAAIYLRSQPRLPSHVVTIKDLVRAILAKRRDTGVRNNRTRPLESLASANPNTSD